ncbi:hypothetical protein PMIN02_003198 [Paraphaeosphaeria minitans]|uniref:Uncharacterized protein n=1 Tax=Paraphaeosphaeria minitans TaxID=565426 RepID=A0A9P6KN42_9PLEO|nr:hypothetical protein PMIN01_09438 [Paraphaeosphaeria minitans]
MSSQSSSTELHAAQTLLRPSSSVENNLDGTGNHLPGPSPATKAARVRRWPVSKPLGKPKSLKASLVRADVQRYQQRLADEWRAEHPDGGKPVNFWKILKLVRYLMVDYAVAIMECEYAALVEFFVKVDCLGALYGWEEKRTPDAEIWKEHLRTIYSTEEDLLSLTLWEMINDYLDGEECQLEDLEMELEDAFKGRDAWKMRVTRQRIKMGARYALYMLRCLWWSFRAHKATYVECFKFE